MTATTPNSHRSPEKLEAELLKGVRSPHRRCEPGEFRKLAERSIVEQAGQ